MRNIIIITTILSSINGLDIFGISLNKIILIPLLIILFIRNMTKLRRIKIHINIYILFYIFALFSCLFSIFRGYNYDYRNTVINYFLQILFIYIPLFVLIYNDSNRENYLKAFIDGLVFSARINVLWGVAQLVSYQVLNIDINNMFFKDILGSTLQRGWTMYYHSGDRWLIRITGLNFENSVYGLIMVLGFFLEKRKLWKVSYFIMLVMSLSRTGLVSFFATYIIKKITMKKIRLRKIKMVKSFITLFAIVAISIYLYKFNSFIQYQINTIINRFTVETDSEGTVRHSQYYPQGLNVFLTRSFIDQQLFGYGPRVSGISINMNKDIAISTNVFLMSDYYKAWNIECDVITLLLGHGIIGSVLYYFSCYECIKKCKYLKFAVFAVLIGGVTYHFYSLTIINLMFILIEANLGRNINESTLMNTCTNRIYLTRT